ncbi:MAG: hypothetical protein EOP10_08985 [Proteobacteria bacterium]|nr:MAG: hypothetical protein EOP10_08985 [Pseudomonadota bacterium]
MIAKAERSLVSKGVGIKANETKTVTINLVENTEPTKLDWKSSFKRFDPNALANKASLCLSYQTKFGDGQFCDRTSLLQDIVFADDSLFRQDDLRDYQGSGDLAQFRRLVTRVAHSDATPEIEDFLSNHPAQLSAYHLASFHSLIRGDCPRVASLNTEHSQFKVKFHPLEFHQAICAEASNNKPLRDQILASGMKDKRAIESLAYWAGLVALESNITKAGEYSVACLKSKASDARCQDLQNIILKYQGKPTRISYNEFEEPIFKHFMTLDDKLRKGQGEAVYFESTRLIEQFPLAIENYVLLNWINTNFNKDLSIDDYADLRIQVSQLKAGGTLDKIVEAVEKADQTQLLPPVYKRRLAFSPKDPNLWYRLIRSYSKSNQCKAMLSAFAEGSTYLPKYNPSLLQMRGGCEVELNRFAEAVTTYKKVMEVNPKIWSSPYNLANSYERMGKKTEAYAFFKKTLELSPPDDVKDNIQARIKFLEPSAP